jgi:hypothetical protein
MVLLAKSPSWELNSFVVKILPVSPLNSKILATYPTYLVDSIRPGGGGMWAWSQPYAPVYTLPGGPPPGSRQAREVPLARPVETGNQTVESL